MKAAALQHGDYRFDPRQSRCRVERALRVLGQRGFDAFLELPSRVCAFLDLQERCRLKQHGVKDVLPHFGPRFCLCRIRRVRRREDRAESVEVRALELFSNAASERVGRGSTGGEPRVRK